MKDPLYRLVWNFRIAILRYNCGRVMLIILFAEERKFLKVLEKNEELRYAGGGLIGLAYGLQ